MIDAPTLTRLNTSCSEAARGYTLASGAMYASFAASMIEAWVDGIDSFVSTDAKPRRSWYRHPDQRSFNGQTAWASSAAPGTAPASGWTALSAFNPTAAFMAGLTSPAQPSGQNHQVRTANEITGWPFMPPIAGWWSLKPTRHPMTTWPMAHFFESSGMPQTVAWPFAEANAAAFDAFTIFTGAMSQPAALNGAHTAHQSIADRHGETHRPARSQPPQSTEQPPATDATTSGPPVALMWMWPVAGATFMAALCDGLKS